MAEIEFAKSFRGLFQPYRDKAFYGGRGSGKSHQFASALVIQAAARPMRIVCGREFQNSTRDSVKQLVEDKIKAHGLSWRASVLETEVRFNNGSRFTFIGMARNPEAVKSLEGADVFWGEEASRFSKRSLEIIRPTIRKPGSEMWWSWNPDKPTDPVDAMFRAGEPPPKSLVKEVSYKDNPWFPPELREEMDHDYRRNAEAAGHIWGGAYRTQSEASVFRNWRVEAFETPPDAVLRFGADWGFANDPTVLVRCWIQGRELRIDHCVSGVGVEVDHTPALFDRVPGSRVWPITADSARPETISYMRRSGFKMREAIKGAGSIEEGVRFLQSFDLVVHPRCDPMLIAELTGYSFKTDPLTGEVLPQLEDRFNNAIDALRYACEAVRRAGGPKPKAAPERGPRDFRGGRAKRSEGVDWKTI